MPLNVRIDSLGATYYLVNSNGTPTPGGSPNGFATTPYSINVRDWTQTAAQRETIYSGSPPFVAGALPQYAGWRNVTETIEIGIAGSGADNTIALIRQLRRILNSALYGTPPLLIWQPHNATNAAYFEIYSADVQEVGDWQNPSAGFTQVLCRVTWTRSPFGGRLSTGETALNSVVFGNTGTGTPNDVASLPASTVSDIQGGPLNLDIPTITNNLVIGTIRQRFYNIVGAGSSLATSSTLASGVTAVSNIPFTIPDGILVPQLRARIIGRISNASSNLQLRATVSATDATLITAQRYYSSPWIDTFNATGFTTIWIDFGGVDLDPWRAGNNTLDALRLRISMRSSTGSATTGTWTYAELVLYWTWAYILTTTNNATGPLRLQTFTERSGRAVLPSRTSAIMIDHTPSPNAVERAMRVIGTPPVFLSGEQLYAVRLGNRVTTGFAFNHDTANTTTITATHAPLYTTLRGNA